MICSEKTVQAREDEVPHPLLVQVKIVISKTLHYSPRFVLCFSQQIHIFLCMHYFNSLLEKEITIHHKSNKDNIKLHKSSKVKCAQ